METRRGHWIFWSWSCSLLSALRCGCWCLNPGPLEEQDVLLTSALCTFLQFTCIIFYNSIPLMKLKMCLYILSSLRSYMVESILGSPIYEHLSNTTDFCGYHLFFVTPESISFLTCSYFCSHAPMNGFIDTVMY